MWLPTKTNLILLKVVAANYEVSQRTREGLAQLHSSLHLAFCESNVIVARFHALVKLEGLGGGGEGSVGESSRRICCHAW